MAKEKVAKEIKFYKIVQIFDRNLGCDKVSEDNEYIDNGFDDCNQYGGTFESNANQTLEGKFESN